MTLKFGFWSEQETQVGHSYARRLHELVDEAVFAEKMGFDFVSLSEQHVALGGISSSAPEVVYGYLAAKTSRIRLRPAVVLMPKNYNHALRSAERLAVQDILSNGRMEFFAGRSNTTIAMRAFNVDANETLGQMEEGLALMKEAMSKDIFKFSGKHYNVPPRMLVPKPLQKPYPIMGIAATGPRSHVYAAEQGMACLSNNFYAGWEKQAEYIALYKNNWKRDENGPLARPSIGIPLFLGIGKTDQEAKDNYAEPLMNYAKISTDAYPRLAKIADDYNYFSEGLDGLKRAATDWDYLVNESGTTLCGSPDTVIRQLERIVDMGVDEVLFHLDSVSHEMILEAIEMVGKYIIPHFRDRNNVVRPTDEILNTIRMMRDA